MIIYTAIVINQPRNKVKPAVPILGLLVFEPPNKTQNPITPIKAGIMPINAPIIPETVVYCADSITVKSERPKVTVAKRHKTIANGEPQHFFNSLFASSTTCGLAKFLIIDFLY